MSTGKGPVEALAVQQAPVLLRENKHVLHKFPRGYEYPPGTQAFSPGSG